MIFRNTTFKTYEVRRTQRQQRTARLSAQLKSVQNQPSKPTLTKEKK